MSTHGKMIPENQRSRRQSEFSLHAKLKNVKKRKDFEYKHENDTSIFHEVSSDLCFRKSNLESTQVEVKVSAFWIDLAYI
jgi:hypothetical protein